MHKKNAFVNIFTNLVCAFYSLKASFVLSLIVHAVFLLLLCINFTHNSYLTPSDNDSSVVVVDMVDINDFLNLKLKQSQEIDGTATKKYSSITKETEEVLQVKEVEPVKEVEETTNNVVVKEPEPLEEQKNDVVIIPTPKKAPKKPLPKVKSPKIKPKHNVQEELGSLLKSIDLVDSKVKNTSQGSDSGLIGKGELSFNSRMAMSQNILTAVKSQLMRCWTVPISSLDTKKLHVVIRVLFNEDGSIKDASIINAPAEDNNYFDIIASSAMKALYKCDPLVGLPKDAYNIWKEMELDFDPQEMM